MKRFIAVLSLTLFAFPAAALAVPDQPPSSGSPLTSRVPDSAADLRAPDQRTPRDLPSRLPAPGTDVAAPDQQASPHAPAPAPAPASDGSDFDWADAGIGAAFAVGLLALSLAGGITVRRRQHRRASALAG